VERDDLAFNAVALPLHSHDALPDARRFASFCWQGPASLGWRRGVGAGACSTVRANSALRASSANSSSFMPGVRRPSLMA
jgi:hypothetical protein